MKNLALATLFALLAACLNQSNDPTTTPIPSETTDDQPAEISCLATIDPANVPEVQAWSGQLPDSPPERSVYVIQPIDDSKFLLTLVYPIKKEIIAAYLLESVEEKLDATSKINDQAGHWPQILLAVLGGLRPLPQPGPPGQPWAAYKKALNAGNALVWADSIAIKGSFVAPSATHGN